MSYKKLNISLGWLAFLIATIVYFITVEDTASLWDCGEYITAAYKLEVGHPPGAPFFMLIGRLFSLFAGSEADVALWINRMSALSSSFSILFLFWTITMLGKKIAQKDGAVMTGGQKVAILGAGFVGAMAYTFTESFWFSAVEGEVYAMSSLFTAVIFWAVLKWDEEMNMIKQGVASEELRPMRWIVLICFLLGLAIGVHLLGLLVVPAIGYIIFFNYQKISKNFIFASVGVYSFLALMQILSEIHLYSFGEIFIAILIYVLASGVVFAILYGLYVWSKTNRTVEFLFVGLLSLMGLAYIQNGVIPGTVSLASSLEIFFVNNIGLPFGAGAAFFFISVIAVLVSLLLYTRKKGLKLANIAILGLIMLFIGYGSFATIVIRSNANPPLDENNPENLVTLHAYLKREQYGSWPILYGEYYNSKPASGAQFEDRSPVYDKRWVVTSRTGSEVAAFKEKTVAENYVKNSGQTYDLVHKYFITNKNTRENQIPVYTQNTFFPRMYFRNDPNRAEGYRNWSGYDPNRRVSSNQIGDDGRPIPTFGENLTFFMNYQVNWMYWRYFMWNFAGRQNDIQGHGSELRGNWISGFSSVDEPRVGATGENAPYFTKENPSNNKFYFIPLILGLIGLFFHFLKAPKDAFVVLLLFLFTGLAIVVYLNQKPFEPRERDYAYAASFYAFAIWIGLGVYGLFEAYRSFKANEYKKLGISYAGILFICLISDLGGNGMPATLSVLIIGAIGGGAIGLMTILKKAKIPGIGAAGLATILGLIAPIILGMQGWDDHDRSNRTPARSLAYNYLIGCSPNSILYTNGDNDTFPLWYLQEVEGVRTDVRVANLSLMQTDWYTEQMMMRAYESDPLPIKFREDQILMGAGNTDYVLFLNFETYQRSLSPEKSEEIIKKKIEANPSIFKNSLMRLRRGLAGALQQMSGNSDDAQEILDRMQVEMTEPLENPGFEDYNKLNVFIRRIFNDASKNVINVNENILKQLQQAANSWTQEWDYLPIDYAMAFVRDDNNMITRQDGRKLRYFPSSGFVLPVNAENAVKAGVITEDQVADCRDAVRFNFRKGGLFRSDVNGLSREEVMMLDILANFNWTRGVYFSSPGGSDVAKALYAEGLVQNYGQIHGLSPLRKGVAEKDGRQKMYENIINKYDYANLSEEGVLVDYYVRRHTDQYRNSFIDLASTYASAYRRSKSELDRDTTGNTSQLKKEMQENADKVAEVISYSLEKLPLDKVFDFGEPRGIGRRLPNGQQIYTDGVMPEYIKVLYDVDKKEEANQLAEKYMKQLETMMNYFENSDPMIAYQNEEAFIAFGMNFLRTYREVYLNNPESPLGDYVNSLERRLSEQVVPGIAKELSQREVSDTRGRRTVVRKMREEAQEFTDLYMALLQENGLAEEAPSDPMNE